MTRTPLPIANGFYESDSLPLSAQECTNWYVNIPQAAALNQENLFGTPGKVQLNADPGTRQANRGAHVLDGTPYFVNGNKLYRQNRTVSGALETFTLTDCGTIEGTGRVSMADNGTQLCIQVPGGKGYIFTESPDSLVVITDVDFRANGNPQHVVFIDGYFLFTTDSKKHIVSALNDGTSYNALDFGTAEADPDDIVAPIVFNNQLFIGGSETLEAFQNIGGADYPFKRTGLFIEKGIAAAFSAIKGNKTFMFIGSGKNESPAIWELSGNTVEKISTTAIDSILQDETDISSAFAWSYAQKGAYFVGFALSETTLVYDTITQRWHERKSNVVTTQGVVQTQRDRANSAVQAYNRILVGDSEDGRIGELDLDTYTEYGRDIIRVAATQPFQNNMESFSVPEIELTMEAGVGNDAANDPVVLMDRSLDGKTYKFARSRRIGKRGDFGHRTIWRRNGRAKRFETFRFTLSDPVKPVIIQLTADIAA
jgi:hypothetical protein